MLITTLQNSDSALHCPPWSLWPNGLLPPFNPEVRPPVTSLQAICNLPENPGFPCLLVGSHSVLSPCQDQGSYVCSLPHIPSGHHQGLHTVGSIKTHQVKEDGAHCYYYLTVKKMGTERSNNQFKPHTSERWHPQ